MSFADLPVQMCIPDAVAYNAEAYPDAPFYVYSTSSENDHLRTITHRNFYHGSLRAAHHLTSIFGKPGQGEVVAIIANSSALVYHTIVVGAMIAGYVPFPISARNSAPAITNLLTITDCHHVLATQADVRSVMEEVSSQSDIRVDETPSFDDVYPNNASETSMFPYPRSHSIDPQSIVMYLHSSGSTGFPKAIPYRNKTIQGWLQTPFNDDMFYATNNREHPFGALGVPPFHATGILVQLFWPIYTRICVAIFPPTPIMPTPANVIDHMKRTKVSSSIAFPSMLTSWVDVEDYVNYLRSLRIIYTGTGPLPEEIGDKLIERGVILHSLYGGTEFGAVTIVDRSEKNWRWMKFHDKVQVRWAPQDDDSYEAQFLSNDDYQMAVTNLDDVTGYTTSDLWVKHPTKEGLWRIIGRKDDVLIHSNGEKTVPGPIEGVITSNPKIASAVMFGRTRDRTGVLIEPASPLDMDNRQSVQSFRDEIWPTIEKANEISPAFSRIYKEMIIITARLQRTAKGSVMRKLALQQYTEQIEKLYQDVESQTENVSLPSSWTKQEDIAAWLFNHANDITKGTVQSSTEDLFHQGFDSLGATFLRLRIQSALKASEDEVKLAQSSISQNFVYDHLSISLMAKSIHSAINDSNASHPKPGSRVEDIESTIERFSSSIDPLQIRSYSFSSPATVLITGTTGNLGAALLRDMLLDSRVQKTYALNRSSSGNDTIQHRQRARFVENGYEDTLLDSAKVVFVEADTAVVGLGINRTLFEDIRQNVNLIIHNAWRLNFNMSLSGFEDNIESTKNLINLALSSPNPNGVRFLFTSSIAVSQSWDKSRGPFPEELQMDASIAQGGGYGEAKYVAERILAHSGLNATSLRIGQMTGGKPRGAWNVSDWVPILLKSSLSIETLPSSNGVISWIPFDGVTSAIMDIGFNSQRDLPSSLNLIHHRPISWSLLVEYILIAVRRRGKDTIRQVLPFPKWFSRMESVANSPEKADLERVPAIKLLEFYRGLLNGDEGVMSSEEAGGMAMLATDKAQSLSLSFKSLPSICGEDVDRWIDYWIFKELF